MIETERLQLIPCNLMHFEAVLQSEQNLAELLDVGLAKDWMQFPEAMLHGLEMLKKSPQNLRWGTYLFLHKLENKLVGNGGFKGATDENGMVEIGYALAPEFWNQGLATEAAKSLIQYAFSWSNVKMVDAHTLTEENASVKILLKCGMTKIAEKHDTEDGNIWQWRVLRAEFEKEK